MKIPIPLANPSDFSSEYPLGYHSSNFPGYIPRLQPRAKTPGYNPGLQPRATYPGLHPQATPSGYTPRLHPRATPPGYIPGLHPRATPIGHLQSCPLELPLGLSSGKPPRLPQAFSRSFSRPPGCLNWSEKSSGCLADAKQC